jgi:hypothetical protein
MASLTGPSTGSKATSIVDLATVTMTCGKEKVVSGFAALSLTGLWPFQRCKGEADRLVD